jgi:hypothetical protein
MVYSTPLRFASAASHVVHAERAPCETAGALDDVSGAGAFLGGEALVRVTPVFAYGLSVEGTADGPVDRDPDADYSTVTLFARFRGWSTSVPFRSATW